LVLRLDKSAGSPTVSGMTVHFSSTPTGIFVVTKSYPGRIHRQRLCNGDDTARGTLAFVSGTDLRPDRFHRRLRSKRSRQPKLFCGRGIDPLVTTAASVTLTITALTGGGGIAINTNSASATFDNTNITALNASPSPNNGALPASLAGSNTNKAILGFFCNHKRNAIYQQRGGHHIHHRGYARQHSDEHRLERVERGCNVMRISIRFDPD